MSLPTGDLTVPELAAHTGVPEATIRWHCRDVRGQLYGLARRSPTGWIIPRSVAEEWAANYRRRPGGRPATQSGPGVTNTPGPLDPRSTHSP